MDCIPYEVAVQLSSSKPNENDCNEIVDHVFLGGYIAALRLPNKIGAVLSVMNTPIDEEFKSPDIEYLFVRANDCDEADLLTFFPYTNQWITDRVQAKINVLVHCMAGISRSATVVCAFIMEKYKIDLESALKLIREKRCFVCPNNGFLSQLNLFKDLNFTLNANDRRFRNYLIEAYFRVEEKNRLIGQYFERLSFAENITQTIESGHEFCCARCSQTVFHEINIVKNEETKGRECATVYIEPMEWMYDQLMMTCLYVAEGQMSQDQAIRKRMMPDMTLVILKCRKCFRNLAEVHRFLTPFVVECQKYRDSQCAAHKALDKYLKVRVIPGSVKMKRLRREGQGSSLAQETQPKLTIDQDGSGGLRTWICDLFSRWCPKRAPIEASNASYRPKDDSN